MNRVVVFVLLFLSGFIAVRARAAGPEHEACRLEARARASHHDRLFSRGLRERLRQGSDQAITVEEVEYRQVGDAHLAATVYRPFRPGKFPALLQVHGGGWVGGTRAQLADISRKLAALGMIVVSVDYRLAPKHRYPAAPEDLEAAAEWMKEKASELGIDLSAGLSVFGFSAGAHLANYFAQTYRGSFSVRRAAVFAGRSDLTVPDLGVDYTPIFLGASPEQNPELARRASPVHRIGDDPAALPQVLLIHQETDPEIDWRESCRFHAAYAAKAGRSKVLIFPEDRPRHGPVGKNRDLTLQALAIFFGVI